MINPLSPPRDRTVWGALSVTALLVSVGATVWLSLLAEENLPLRDLRDRWHDIAYVLLTLLVVSTLAGTLLHTLHARNVGRSVPLGWLNAGLVLAYAGVIALLAWWIRPFVGSSFGSGRGGGPLGAYLTWQIFSLVPLAIVAWTGALFPRTGVPARFYKVPLVALGLGWAFSALPFVVLVIIAITRR